MAMNLDFSGKVALVTGAASGIGRDIATLLHSLGARLVAVDINEAGLASLASELAVAAAADERGESVGASSGGEPRVRHLVVDLTSEESIKEAAAAAGDVDLLVNVAGVAFFEPFFETSKRAYELQMAVNVRAPMVLTQAVAAGMVKRVEAVRAAAASSADAGADLGEGKGEEGAGGGVGGPAAAAAAGRLGRDLGFAVVNISSQSSTVALADHMVYSMTKSAIDHMTRVQALELGGYGIRVNAVNPTVVLTELALKNWTPEGIRDMESKLPVGRLAQPRDVAHVVAFLLSPFAAMVTGVTLPVDGGFLCCRK